MERYKEEVEMKKADKTLRDIEQFCVNILWHSNNKEQKKMAEFILDKILKVKRKI